MTGGGCEVDLVGRGDALDTNHECKQIAVQLAVQHSDITKPAVAHAVWEAALALG